VISAALLFSAMVTGHNRGAPSPAGRFTPGPIPIVGSGHDRLGWWLRPYESRTLVRAPSSI
jgi:hypothetical protein